MGHATLPGNPPVEITVRRSARARRVSLRVSALDGRVTLSLPKAMKTAEALAFAEEKSDWIRRHLARREAEITPAIGGAVSYEGIDLPIRAGAVRSAKLIDGALVVPDAPGMVPARIKAFLTLTARKRLHAASDHYSGQLGQTYGRITLRDTRSRWGSCSHAGDLMYSWRLIMAPAEVLDYVAAHEVAHLVELNHSRAFWNLVAKICPDYAAPRLWLRQQGHMLHRYRFGD